MSLRILGALLRKEVSLMRRNPFIPRIILAMPVMVMLILPLVTTLDLKNVNVAVADLDRSTLSRRLVADMDATEELKVANVCLTHSEAMAMVEGGEADVVLTVPRDFEQTLPALSIEANGVNATKGMLGAQYVSGSVMTTLRQWSAERGAALPAAQMPVQLDRYNPTLNFRNYMIPALMVVLLIIICGFLPTLNFVSEKESGTIEAMNVTPVGKMTFVLSKLIPFWVVGLMVVTVGMCIGWLVYGLVPVGSVWAIYFATVLFSLFMSALGVTVANRSATMLQSIFVMFAIIMIFQLMGGLFTPIGSMPGWAQTLTYAVPTRYFNEIMRAVYLRGAGVADLWLPYACLGGFALLTCLVAALTYRKQS